MTAKTVPARLSSRVYKKAAAMAACRDMSLEKLFRKGLKLLEKTDEQSRLYDEFTLMGSDAEGCDVGFAACAQTEVVRRNE